MALNDSGRVVGRVIGREGNALRILCDRVVAEAHGDANLGDLVWVQGADVVVVARYSGREYPPPHSEVVRMTPARRQGLIHRGQVLERVRRFFSDREFLEVETPVRVPAPGVEVHLEAVPSPPWFLATSPEFQMKRLLVAGLQKIFTVCRCFRAHEQGKFHNSEFTMLEWYRAFADLESVLLDTEQLVADVVAAVQGQPVARVGNRMISVEPPWERMTVSDAFSRWVGVDLRGDESAGQLRETLAACGVATSGAVEWDDLFYCAFVERIEPQLRAFPRALFLTAWPRQLAALARLNPDDSRIAERFEAYVGGIELANAFGELTCPHEQRRRFACDLAARERRGLPTYPLDAAFLAALEEGMPPSAGIALGVDRLALVATGADHIRDVSSFTTDEL